MGRKTSALAALCAVLTVGGCSGQADAEPAAAAPTVQPTATAASTPAPADSAALAPTPAPRVPVDSTESDSARRAREIEVMRETFAYSGGTRDPFNSLIGTVSSGPELSDLQLVGVYQDLRSPSNSVVVLREKLTEKRHKMRVGDRLARLRLVQIRPRDAVFTIQDLGFERQETLSLRKQEEATP